MLLGYCLIWVLNKLKNLYRNLKYWNSCLKVNRIMLLYFIRISNKELMIKRHKNKK